MRPALQHAVRFVCAGALLFAAQHWLTTPEPPPGAPVAAAGDGDDALLLRAAFALGLDDSRTVNARLATLAESLDLAAAGDAVGLVREARAVGLERSDPVVQRHLVELTRLAASSSHRPPDEAALRAFYSEHAARFATPERVRLTQIYLSGARRGDAARRDATALRARLRTGGIDAGAAAALGDGLGRAGAALGPLTRDELGRALGPAFADAVFTLPVGEWQGPVASSYGLHLVRLEERLPAAAPDFARVRSRVLHAYLRQRGAAQLHDALAALRAP